MARWRDIGYSNAEGPKIEVTITEKGTLKGGIETTDTVTYWSIPRRRGLFRR